MTVTLSAPVAVAADACESGGTAVVFTDVSADHTFCAEVSWLASTGITVGRADGTFGPEAPLTRGAMAAFLYRLSGEPPVPTNAPTFPDVTDSHNFNSEISWLASTGITVGRADGTFGPEAPLTRGAMAAFLYRLSGAGGDDEGDDSTAPPPDVEPLPPPPSGWSEAWGSGDEGTIGSWYRQNTGIAAAGLVESDLTVHNGTLNTERDGQVIDGMLVNGQINIRHDDVTIRNTKVVNNGGTIAVNISFDRGNSGDVDTFTMENVSLIGTGGASEYRQAVGATFAGLHHGGRTANVGLRASRVYISGFGGGFRLSHYGDDTVELSMVENIRTHPGSHNTGMSFRGGDGKTVTRNWIEGSTSSALSLYPDSNPITNFTARENLFDGGTYSVLAGNGKSYSPQSHPLRFIDNRFTRNHQYGPRAAWDPDAPGNQWTGNTYLDGQPIN